MQPEPKKLDTAPTADRRIDDRAPGPERGRWRARRWALWLPNGLLHWLWRIHYARQIRRGTFGTDEPAYRSLEHLLQPGDVAIDVGANVGRYALRMAELVGPTGCVLALEPVPETAAVLLANVMRSGHRHVAVLQAAASDRCEISRLRVPVRETGFAAHYFAHLVDDPANAAADQTVPVACCTIDAIGADLRVALVKIDVEKHETKVLKGMARTASRARPFILIEPTSDEPAALLGTWGYEGRRLGDSQDWLFWPREKQSRVRRALESASARV